MIRAAIQGVRGAFSHAAAIEALGPEVEVVECRTFEGLFRSVAEGAAERGVVPVENTLAGSVQRSTDLLAQHTLVVVGEVRVRIRLCLAAPSGTTLHELRRVASHPVALEQCLGFFERNPHLERVTAFDTAGSVRDLVGGAADYDAAVCSELAASLHGAHVILHGLEDDPGNYTRFLIVARPGAGRIDEPGAARGAGRPDDPTAPGGVTKTSIVFTLPHRPGALHRALGCFAEQGVDLTRIESRPIRGSPWRYRFHVDLRGSEPRAEARALEALRAHATELRVLGRYREAAEDTGG